MSGRLIGMLFAGVLAGVVLALVGVALLTAPPAPQRSVAPTPELGPDMPDLLDTPVAPMNQASGGASNSGAGGMDAVLGRSEDWAYTIANADNELAVAITAGSFTPEGRGRYALTDIRATFFPDGRVVRLRADEGIIEGQRNETPESGALSGSVTVSLFPPGATERDAIAHEAGTGDVAPQYTFDTEQLRFDTTLGQGVANGRIAIAGPGLRLDGRGLTLRFGSDSANDEPTLRLLRLEESDGLQLWPDRFPTNDDRAERTRDERDSTASNDTDTNESLNPTVYALDLDTLVTIARGSYNIRADRLEAHARLFGGELRADAIAPLRLNTDDASTRAARRATGAAPVGDPGPDDDDRPIVVTWNGALELAPLLEAPGVLDFDDAAIRFSARDDGGVTLGDDLTRTTLSARTVTYFATGALFQARAGTPNGVRLEAARVARLTSSAIDVDLSRSPDVAALVRTPGAIEDRDGRTVRWNDTAEARATLAGDRVLPTGIDLTGGVELRDGPDSAEANTLRVLFDDAGVAERIEAEGSVTAVQPQNDRSITGDAAVITLAGEGDRTRLVSTEVTGSAWGIEGERTYEADSFRADFADDEVVGVLATGDVRVTLDDALRLRCAEVRSDRTTRSIDLLGDADGGVTVTRTDPGFAFVATVGSARVEEDADRITGFGPGEGRMESDDPSSPYSDARLNWGGGFVFDGSIDRLELLGGVDVAATRDASEVHTASGERAEIDLEGVSEGDTRVVGARLYAGPGPDGQEIPATAEARRTAPNPSFAGGDGAPRVLESLLSMSAGELLVDAQAQTMRAPGAGRLVVEDQRPDERTEDPDTADTRSTTRGTSVFRWAGGMDLDLASGEATLERDVRVRHLARGADDVTQLDCQRLDAFFTSEDPDNPNAFAVTRLLARESVYAGHLGLELLADSLEYLASREQIRADARGGNRVTVFDPERAGHYTASSVLLDLVTGNWTSTDATGAVGAP